MHDVIARIAVDTLLVLLGYSIHFVWKDLLLERKRLRALAMLEEVQQIAEETRRREADLRRRHQRMVEQMSQLKADYFDENPGSWSPSDDTFLASWISADRHDARAEG